MLSVEHLVKQFGDFTAVDDVSFEAGAGAVFGLLGPNGAGKSTTINCITGLLRPTSGLLAVAGHDVTTEPAKAKRSLGVVPQEIAIYEDLPAADNLRYWGQAYGLQGKELDSRVREVLDHIGLADRSRELPKKFSGGMKRRLNFGCGIVHRPTVLLLDEPTVGVDPQSRERLFELVEQERDNGACVLYTTHYMEEAERLCDSLGIIDHGKLIAQGSVEQLRDQLGARDVLQLTGEFHQPDTGLAIKKLQEQGLPDLETIASGERFLTITLSSASQNLPMIFAALSQTGASIAETNLRSANLETLFLALTGKELRE
jgi:ABC-2 type transport system ATP-binding protein